MSRRIVTSEKERYKLYKSGKFWITAGITSISFFIGSAYVSQSNSVQADTINSPTEQSTNSSSITNSNSQVVLSSTTSSSTTTQVKTGNSSANTTSTQSSTSSDDASSSSSNAAGSKSESSGNPNAASSAISSSESDSVASVSDTAASSQPASSVPSSATPAANSTSTTVLTANKMSRDANSTSDTKAASAAVTLSHSDIGYGNTSGDIQVIYSFTGNAGDVFTITIPANTSAYSLDTVPTMPSGQGSTTSVKNTDGSTTVTNILTVTSSYQQTITLNQNNNYLAQATPMTDIGTTTKTITYAINGITQSPVTFTQVIKPNADLSTPTRTYPASSVDAVLPNTDYVYSFSVNEADGVLDSGYVSDQVNSAANYGGTTITIPVPSSFVLNSSLTASLNSFTDGTTITQSGGTGGDIIITVPAGDGKQNYQDTTDLPYKIAGSYDITQTASNQALTAAGPATMTQITNAAGDVLTATANGSWSETILAIDDPGKTGGSAVAKGNSSSSALVLLLDGDTSNDPQFLNTFTFSTSSAASPSDATITINIPDGLDATSIKVPKSGANTTEYLPGTTLYTYTITLANGSTESGTVAAGGTITPTVASAIRSLVLKPNFLVAGATSGSSLITVYGTLSSTYDDGSAVENGDTLTSTIHVSFNNGATTTYYDDDITQTVSTEGIAKVSGYIHQTSQAAGTVNAGSISLAMSGNTDQTTNSVYEPIYYFVVPASSTITSITNVPAGGTISQFLADDGRVVVKVDYTGSGVYVTTQETYLIQINLANNSDALPGNYPLEMYVTSPVTKLQNTTPVTDTSYTDGDANAFQFYTSNWSIIAVSTVLGTSLAQGNQNLTAVQNGVSFPDGDTTLQFYDVIVNTSDKAATNVTSLVNLPTVGDSQGSQYTFELTGPITLPTNFTTTDGTSVPINATVLYSTRLQTPGNTADTAGYVTADQVTDWSSIRSIIIQFDSIPSNASTGRITITGTAADFANQTGKTGHLETAFYADNYEPVTAGRGTAAQISILNPPAVTLPNVSFSYDGTTKASEANNITQLLTSVVLADGSSQTLVLTTGDFKVSNDGFSANSYTYTLTSTGLAKLQAIAGLEQIKNPDTTGIITINPVATTPTLNNVNFNYDGTTKASDATDLVAKVSVVANDGTTKEISLTSSDIVVSDDGTDAGNYSYKLSTTGLKKIKSELGSNYTVNQTDIKDGTITINPTATTPKLSNVDFDYDGTTRASDATNLTASVKLTDGTTKVINLTKADITVSNDSVQAGNYEYTLNATGLANVQKAVGDNYSIGTDKNTVGSIIIDPITATVKFNNNSIIYNGTTKASSIPISVTVTLPDGITKVIEWPEASNYINIQDSVNAGTYVYDLNATGKTALSSLISNELGPNYTFNLPTSGKNVIEQAPATIVAVSDDNVIYDGTNHNLNVTTTGTVNNDVLEYTVNNNSQSEVGQYTVDIIPTSDSTVNSNYDIKITNGSLTIKAARATVNLNNVSLTYDGITKASDATGLTATVQLLNGTPKIVSLSSSDISVANDNTNTGTYDYILSATGVNKLQNAVGNNYQVTSNATGNITIKDATSDVILSSSSFTYDGTTKASDTSGLTASVTLANGTTKQILLNSNQINVTNDDSSVGKYTYTLNVDGIAAIQQAVGNNYQFNTTDAVGDITINKATAPISLNNGGFAFDGITKASQSDNLTANVTLADGSTKQVALTSADIVVPNDSTKGGNYDYTLSPTGKAKVQAVAGNNYTIDDSNALGQIVIASPPAIILGQQTFNYNGSQKASEAKNLTTILVMPDGSRQTINLTSNDIVVDQDSVNVGRYTFQLSTAGLSRLQKLVGTDDPIVNPDLTSTITIAPATVSANLNNQSFTYDGEDKASDANGLFATVALGSGVNKEIPLTESDIIVNSDSVNANSYSYRLTDTGLAKIQTAIGNNYQVNDNNASGTITIKQANVTITAPTIEKDYDGQPNKIIETVTGKPDQGVNLNYTITNVTNDISVGNYPIHITANANDNPNYSIKVVDGNLKINQAMTTATLSGTQTVTYNGQKQVPNASDFSVTLPNSQMFTLSNSDIELIGDGTNIGNYQVQLTESGKQAIEAMIGSNYKVDFDGIGNFTIIAANATKVKADDKTINAGDPTPTFSITYGDGLTVANLTNSDFEFFDTNGNLIKGIPTAAGTYTIKLNTTGIDKIKSANPNFLFTDANFLTGIFTINDKQVTPPNSGETPNTPGNNANVVPDQSGQPGLGKDNLATHSSNQSTSTVTVTSNVGDTTYRNQSGQPVKSVTGQVLTAKPTGSHQKLPQTGEQSENFLVMIGLSMLTSLLGLFGFKKKKQNG